MITIKQQQKYQKWYYEQNGKQYHQDRYISNKELQKEYDRKKYLWNKTIKELRNIQV